MIIKGGNVVIIIINISFFGKVVLRLRLFRSFLAFDDSCADFFIRVSINVCKCFLVDDLAIRIFTYSCNCVPAGRACFVDSFESFYYRVLFVWLGLVNVRLVA